MALASSIAIQPSERYITDVDFRIPDGRIYDVTLIMLGTKTVAPNNSSEPVTIPLEFSYTDTWKGSWNVTGGGGDLSNKLGIRVHLSSPVPTIVKDGIIEVTSEYHNSDYEWGEIVTSQPQKTFSILVVVPPKSTVTVTLQAKIGTCDVPFSYTQEDIFPDGKTIVGTKDDGIYTGTNMFGFQPLISRIVN